VRKSLSVLLVITMHGNNGRTLAGRLTFDVPKPQLGLLFFTDMVCGPKLSTTCDVIGPGVHSPNAPFSCSLVI